MPKSIPPLTCRDCGKPITQVLGHTGRLVDVIGTARRTDYLGAATDVIALPHPSGASPWHKIEPGKTLLETALGTVRRHPAIKATFG